mmetsp:Transcript_8721/g.20005  ORF Transcript_8721/g.20005 Transcript_8721/m.20005 type:complete len:370 (+) Transcript_8721:125-1234(+)
MMVSSSKDTAPSLLGVPMKWVSLLMLVAQTVSVVFMMRLSRTSQVAGPRYLNTTAVFFSEVVKLFCSYLFLCQEQGSLGSAASLTWVHFTRSPVELLKVLVPSLLYTLQNNLLFVALSHLSGAVYQVTYQLKILTTAILSVIILGKALGPTKWAALVTLTAGVALIQLPRGMPSSGASEASDETSTTTAALAVMTGGSGAVGLAAVLSACVTSGLAGVYLEKILKQTDASIWLRNIQLAFFGAGMAFFGALIQDGSQIREAGFMQGYSMLVWAVILLQAVGGLVVAAVLKYADNILKCFGNALSIVISCMLSGVLLREFEPDLLFVLGTLLVLLATTMYSIGVPEWVQLLWNRQLGGVRKSKVDELGKV